MVFVDDPLWYKDAIIYELHVKAFRDSTGDGIGDFRGLTEKLDYLQDLGVTALWLLPFYPSPQKDDGYDISDYRGVHPDYGTLQDVRVLIKEAHRRGLKIITELVINHTSDQHPWFQAARRAKAGSARHRFYVWSDTDKKFPETRIIFCDTEKSNWSWDPVAGMYYWHRFYSHQPDLNHNNPQVVQAVIKAMRFWLDLGVDGLRLDAVPYLCVREGTNNENVPETHEVIKEIRRQLDARYRNRMLLAEANMWPEDVRPYFGDGDECHMAFHFPVMPRIYMALRREDRQPIVEIMNRTPPIPENCQWAIFLRNHDELTLEMVTNEERDYMYREYARDPRMRLNLGIRRRLAPLVDNSIPRLMMLNSLLFSFPGTPVIYYGDEIGMGDNIYLGDRNGVRTPMQWSAERNAGFSSADPARLYLPVIMDAVYGYQAVNVEAQQRDPSSLLHFMKRIIGLRRQYQAFGRGSLEFLHPKNRKVLAYLRRYKEEVILCVVNLSRFVQPAEMDLSQFQGWTPVEMFGRTEFPPIGELPYFFTLGPHAFYWFKLEPEPHPIRVTSGKKGAAEVTPTLTVEETGDVLFEQPQVRTLEEDVLQKYILRQRWYQGKVRSIIGLRIRDAAKVGAGFYLLFVEVSFSEGPNDIYCMPVKFVTGGSADRIAQNTPESILAFIKSPRGNGAIIDALSDQTSCRILLSIVADSRRFRTMENGEVRAFATPAYHGLAARDVLTLEVSRTEREQTNSSVTYGENLILKVFRHVEKGGNPELEVGRFLTIRARFPHTPQLAGGIEYYPGDGGVYSVGIVQNLVANEGDGWGYTQGVLKQFFSSVEFIPEELRETLDDSVTFLDLSRRDSFGALGEFVGPYLDLARLLGVRTAELHLALTKASGDKSFTPEPMSAVYLETFAEQFSTKVRNVLEILNQKVGELPAEFREPADRIMLSSWSLIDRFRALKEVLSRGGHLSRIMVIRCHGDYHLGQVLKTDNDFVILDFEGEPLKPLAERRAKQSPLKDVAGMLRSFSYAAQVTLLEQAGSDGAIDQVKRDASVLWEKAVSAAFFKSYVETCGEARFLPAKAEELGALLTAFMLDKAYYELHYELSYRPDWVHIPLLGIDKFVSRGGAR